MAELTSLFVTEPTSGSSSVTNGRSRSFLVSSPPLGSKGQWCFLMRQARDGLGAVPNSFGSDF